jgi:hypothetical protein
MIRSLLITIIAVGTVQNVSAQGHYVGTRGMTYHLVDRYRVLQDIEAPMVTSTNNYLRSDISEVGLSIYNASDNATSRANAIYLLEDNAEYLSTADDQVTIDTSLFKSASAFDTATDDYQIQARQPILKHFYKDRSTFLTYESDHFYFRTNPILEVSGGVSADENTNVFTNLRGLEIRGAIDNKVYFYTSLLETQRGFLNYQNNTIESREAIPGNGLYKLYESSVLDQLSGYDYLNAVAYFGVPISKHVAIEIGHGSHHIGQGYRSLLLSDFANNYFYMKLNSRVGKFQLQNLFGELATVPNTAIGGDNLIPKKYFANHTLTYRPNNRFAISLFETVVFSRENQYELQYLNPIILYRTVEQFIGSPDNVILGLDGRWDLFKRLSLYGQFVLDEFNLTEFSEGDGWWGNKYGVQLGLKYFDVANVDHLDIQLETNIVRPWTYSHGRTVEGLDTYSLSSYTHFGQPMAHPLGSNFVEMLGILRYQPLPRLHCQVRGYVTTFGGDTDAEAFGGDIFRPNTDRSRQEGYQIGDGDRQMITGVEAIVSYMFAHNYFVDLTLLRRQNNFESGVSSINTSYVGLGVRVNTATMPFDY